MVPAGNNNRDAPTNNDRAFSSLIGRIIYKHSIWETIVLPTLLRLMMLMKLKIRCRISSTLSWFQPLLKKKRLVKLLAHLLAMLSLSYVMIKLIPRLEK